MDEQIRPKNITVAPTGTVEIPAPATRADLLLGDIQNRKVLSGGFLEKAQGAPAVEEAIVKRGFPSYKGDTEPKLAP